MLNGQVNDDQTVKTNLSFSFPLSKPFQGGYSNSSFKFQDISIFSKTFPGRFLDFQDKYLKIIWLTVNNDKLMYFNIYFLIDTFVQLFFSP